MFAPLMIIAMYLGALRTRRLGIWCKTLPHVSGPVRLDGFRLLGRAYPYWWPSRSSFFGIVDLAGFPKDVYYMYKSEWTDEPVLHIFPHWNWKEGEPVDIWAYYNNADEVETIPKRKEPRRTTKNGQYLSCLLAYAFYARNLESRLPLRG